MARTDEKASSQPSAAALTPEKQTLTEVRFGQLSTGVVYVCVCVCVCV